MTAGRLQQTPFAVATEALASYAAAALFVAVFTAGDGRGPSLASVALVVVASFGLGRLLQHTDFDEQAIRIVGLTASVTALFVVAQVEYADGGWSWDFGWLGHLLVHPQTTLGEHKSIAAGTVALGALWLRGVARGQQPIDFDDVLASASAGVIAMGIAAAAGPHAGAPESFGVLALGYAVASLAVLALYRVPDADVSIDVLMRRTSVPLTGVVGGSALIAVVALAIDPGAFGFAAPAGRVLGTGLAYAFAYTIGPLFLAIEYGVRGIAWLLGLLVGDFNEPQPQEVQPLPEPEPEKESGAGAPWWERLLRWTGVVSIAALIVVVALLLLWSAFKRYARNRKHDARDRRESVEAASTLGDDLRALFGALRRDLTRGGRVRGSQIEVRRLYHEMLAQASAGGVVRPPAATPSQFAPALDAHFASTTPDVMTAAFAESRYGEHVIDEERIRELRAAWGRIAAAKAQRE